MEKNLQMENQIQLLVVEKEAMELSMEELQKKLELSVDWLLQSSHQILQTLAHMHILKKVKVHSAQELHQLKTILKELRSQLEDLST
jgi:hypothetical protein